MNPDDWKHDVDIEIELILLMPDGTWWTDRVYEPYDSRDLAHAFTPLEEEHEWNRIRAEVVDNAIDTYLEHYQGELPERVLWSGKYETVPLSDEESAA